MRVALKQFDVILSDYILEEARQKLSTKLKIPPAKIKLFEDFLRKRSAIVATKSFSDIQFSDKKDIPILSLLRVASPHYFVTGDQRLLDLKKFERLLIISPREAMEVFHSFS